MRDVAAVLEALETIQFDSSVGETERLAGSPIGSANEMEMETD